MNSTGYFRHMDDLGRVVIPKAVRMETGISEGDRFEIFTDNKQIILVKQPTKVPDNEGLGDGA